MVTAEMRRLVCIWKDMHPWRYLSLSVQTMRWKKQAGLPLPPPWGQLYLLSVAFPRLLKLSPKPSKSPGRGGQLPCILPELRTQLLNGLCTHHEMSPMPSTVIFDSSHSRTIFVWVWNSGQDIQISPSDWHEPCSTLCIQCSRWRVESEA